MTLPDKLQQNRKLNKYSQEKLAELIGVSRQAVTKWENGKSAPSTENLIKLAGIYKVALDDLINDTPETINGELNPKRSSRAKLIGGLWTIILIVLIMIYELSKNFSLAWSLFNLALLITIILSMIYFFVLLAKAMNKYIHS